jgi:hypothetical protein
MACAAGLLLTACNDGPAADAPSTDKAAAPKPARTAVGMLPPEMVAAVSSARNSDVVSVHFTLNGTPAVSKALPVDIAIIPHKPVASLNAHFEARDGLALATGSMLERVTDPATEKVIKHQIILLPGKEGVFMVTAVVETESGDGTVSRIFSIPVIVGPAAAGTPAPPPPTNPASG